jgi:hypothetical protein
MPVPGLISKLKKNIAESGRSKKGFWYVKADDKRRVRFVKGSNLEQAYTIPWHSKWEGQRNIVDSPCLRVYGKDCPYCDQEEVKTVEKFAWTVYDYLAKEKQILLAAANRASPVPHLVANWEEWGTITDRDITIKRTGAGKDTTYTVIGDGPKKFMVEGIKPYSEDKILDMVWKAFGTGELDQYSDADESESEEEEEDEYEEEEDETDDEEEEEELPPKRKSKPTTKPKR